MSIKNSVAFYRHLLEHPEIRKAFYHFTSLTGLCQYERLFEYVEAIPNKGLRILDWGCGNGWFSYYLWHRGFTNVVSYGYGWDAIDPGRKYLPALQYVNGEEAQVKNPSDIPFPDNSFDLIFSVGVLEHVHETGGDQMHSMREINRILRPGGRFFCYHLPNQYTWIEFIKGLFVSGKGKHYLHTKKFTSTDINNLAADSGFEVSAMRRYNVLPYNIHRNALYDNRVLASLYTGLDNLVLNTPLSHLSQCYLFEAIRKENA